MWLRTIELPDGAGRINRLTREPRWRPKRSLWETIKKCSIDKQATVTIVGVNRKSPKDILSAGQIGIKTSSDKVAAPIFYREVNRPFVAAVHEYMPVDKDKMITWSDYKRGEGEGTYGLLSQVSPDGRFVVSTVKDESVFVPKPGLDFSQLFFPVKGILCIYDRQTGVFESLPGADDPNLVQSNPTWSPDGKHIVFAATEASRLKNISRR